MKLNIEVELSPEEARRLVGLPDAQPFWDAVGERISEGDTEMLVQMVKTMSSQGLKTADLLQRTIRGFASFKRRAEEEVDEMNKTAEAAPKKRATSSRRKKT